MRTIAALLLLFAVTAVADDSPLVAASKKSKRARESKTPVITNKDLVTSGGHVTTTKSQRDVPKLKAPATKKAATTVAAPAKADAPATTTEPVDDATAYGPEDRDPDNVHDPIPSAKIPDAIAAKPQFTKPQVVPPAKPPVSKSTTPQYTQQDKH